MRLKRKFILIRERERKNEKEYVIENDKYREIGKNRDRGRICKKEEEIGADQKEQTCKSRSEKKLEKEVQSDSLKRARWNKKER